MRSSPLKGAWMTPASASCGKVAYRPSVSRKDCSCACMFSSAASADASLADMTFCWIVSLYILTASHASGTRTATPTAATSSAVRHRRLDSDFALMRSEIFPAGFEKTLHLADEVERAGHADRAAGRRVRARNC